jgi:hypothetical protein
MAESSRRCGRSRIAVRTARGSSALFSHSIDESLALWLPDTNQTAMASISALLVVLTLTGEPVANALCVSWCDTSSETMVCDEAIAGARLPEQTMAAVVCAAILTTVPFLSKEGRDIRRNAAVAVAIPLVPPGASGVPVIRTRGATTDGHPVPLLALRI